jgi:nucleotide-binding universal stress UspA family protein
MKTIVLGYDDTVPAKHALERTAELARAFQANVVVVSVAPVLAPAAHGIGHRSRRSSAAP